ATAAVSDYHQPPGAKPSGRVLLPPAYRNAARQHTASASGKTTPPVGMVKAGPAGSAPLGPGQTLSAHSPSTSPPNGDNSIAPDKTNVRPAIAAVSHYPGTIEGYVFWDATWDQPFYCDAINITVSVSETPNVYRSLGTLGSISEYLGTVKYQEQGIVGNV